MTVLSRIALVVLFFYVLPVTGMVIARNTLQDSDWWQLRRDSSDQAPPAATNTEAVIQVYGARAARWRGAFGVHTWFATKKQNESNYTRVEVIGYAVRWGSDAVRIRRGVPDAYWYGNHPTLLSDVRGGSEVDALIDRLHDAAINYEYNDSYRVWPGPNSNTFTAYMGRLLPELKLELPTTALGKDYLPLPQMLAKTPSGTGVQLSLGGYAGLLLSAKAGFELNLLGLSAGIDLNTPALKFPGLGRLGFKDKASKY